MQVVYQRCCGLDIHKRLIVACLLLMSAQGEQREMRTFGTTLAELYRLRDWLKAHNCQMVAMESTGVYWKPIWNVLEEELALMLVNAQHIKAVPGRKTDTKDAEWIAERYAAWVAARQFRAAAPAAGTARADALPDETGGRASAAGQSHAKVLEDRNVKLSSVATDITGVSGRAILQALLARAAGPPSLG